MTGSPNSPTTARLRELLAAYGADPSRWPAKERERVEGLGEDDPALRSLLEEAAALDARLDALPDPVPSPALRRSIAEVPLRHPRRTRDVLPWVFRSVWRATLSAAFVALLGLMAGALSLESGESDESWAGMAALTFATPLDMELEP